jgi:hypothetical protein
MKENGLEIKETDLAPKFGLMEPSMKEIGIKTKHKASANFSTSTGIFLKETGPTIKLTASEYIAISTELSTKDYGKMISNMERSETWADSSRY